ncbi:MAG: glycogen debranching protein [Acidobacteriaceae bacterium]|nr:glycogen debranching protein [Acidobacteriaceae bacterium]
MSRQGLPILFVLASAALAAAELNSPSPNFAPLTNFAKNVSTPQILAPCVPREPWTVAGERGALLGRQNGVFEGWQWPVKILSNFRIRAELANYDVPIDVNALAAEIKVTPAETIITYSHAAFTIRQHMFAARGQEQPPTSAAVFFEIESARPIEITFSFTPEMLRMWPAPNFGRPNGEWVGQENGPGLYVLHTDNSQFSGIVAMPRTKPGIMVPYQEHPQTYPLELKLSFDPKRDHGLVFPLVMAVADGSAPAAQAETIFKALPEIYERTQQYYSQFRESRAKAETPNSQVNEALAWAEVAIDQMQVNYHGETGMVAGYYESADSARPGYAWFFGRDTLWTTYAINSYGDFALTKRALDFLIRRQRADGKIMHEFSQSADALDWKSTPYFYASADATPLLVMATWDYVKTSGDTAYLKANWEVIRKAYAFTRAHEGNDGIYSNSEGTGWVESWPTGMPAEEIYLAAMDQQSATAMSHLAGLMGDQQLSQAAHDKAGEIGKKIESEYYEPSERFYAFSRNRDGSLDHTASIYPAVAWWDGTFALKNAGPMLTRWASGEFSADWGTRDISEKTPFYDPISYHQGSIWPLFTGWASLAQYRAGRPLAGYASLMQNLDLTWAQDLGSVTELLSGEFYQPLGRSSSHQMWSSAMVISPLLRGLFGLDWDAANRTLRLAPHLPADWDHAALRQVKLGDLSVDLEYTHEGSRLVVRAKTERATVFCLAGQNAPEKPCAEAAATAHNLAIALPGVEIGIPAKLPEQGSTTQQLKVLDEQYSEHKAVFRFAAMGGSKYDLPVRLNRSGVSAQGVQLSAGEIHLQFPEGDGYQTATATFTW